MSKEAKNTEVPKTITITLPAWMGAEETYTKYKRQVAEGIPTLEKAKANLEKEILETTNPIYKALYQLNKQIIEEKLQRVQSDESFLEMIASLVESYDSTQKEVFRLQDEIMKLPVRQRRKLNKITKELAKKIETTLRPIKDIFDNTEQSSDDDGTEGVISEIPPRRLYE